MPAFNVGGIASRLDTESIISQLMDLERRPLRLMQQRESAINVKLGLYQQINTLAATMKSATSTIGQSSTLQSASVTSSDTDTIGVSATSSANFGTYVIGSVTSLAQQSVHRSSGFATQDTAIGGAAGSTLTLTVGSDSVTVNNYETKSLLEIRDEINNANIGMSASVYSSGSQYHLMVTAKNEGTANAVTVTTDTGSLAMTALSSASDLVFQLGSGGSAQTITRTSNTVDDLISGVTLTFKQTKGTATNVAITPNIDQNVTNINTWVEAVNGVMGFLNEQLKFVADATRQGPLVGDSTLNGIRSDIRSKLTSEQTGLGTSTVTALSRIGISINRDTGQLTVDSARLREQLAAKPSEVQAFFEALSNDLTNVSRTGLFDRLTDTIDGTIATRIEGFNTEIKRLQDSQAQMEQRLATKEERLRLQFIRLEQAIAESNSQFSYFQSQLGGLTTGRR
ncbi:hypothetical protein FJZ36_16680 [Candidatus Poribacteria bacterium]|nr:hypothetical protein [Candidatus Poribacteria bacterium]